MNKSTAASSEFSAALGAEIFRLRRERSLTGKELGNLVGVSQQQVSRYENGICEMTLSTLCKLLHGLDVSLEDFFYFFSAELKFNHPVIYTKYQFLFLQTEEAHAIMNSMYSKFQ